MKIVNDALLKEFRRKTRCEFCGRYCPQGVDPHHIIKRGLGGGSRVDIPLNVIGLCRGFTKDGWVSCHQDADDGKITKAQLFAVVGKREGWTKPLAAEEVEAEVRRIIKEPKP